MSEEVSNGYNFEEIEVDTKPLPDYLPVNRVIQSFQSVIERYFVPKFKLENDPTKDKCVLIHSNKICLITLAPNHPILNEKKTVVKVNYQISDRTNRLDNKVSGKKKRGGQKLQVGDIVCVIDCQDGAKFEIKSGLKGNLMEVNERLIENPSLLVSNPWDKGYMAVMMLPLHPKDALTNEFGFVSLEEYEKERPRPTSETS